MTIRRATLADAASLAAFGRRVFHDTFAPDNRPQDLAAYLDHAYGEAQQRAEIADPAMDTLLVETDGALMAFAQLRPADPPPGVPAPAPIELWRFYVDPAWHGRGVARRLMAEVTRRALERGADTIWLGVWERNTRAQAFYRKQGFVVAGSQIFMMGEDTQRDLVMVRSIRSGV